MKFKTEKERQKFISDNSNLVYSILNKYFKFLIEAENEHTFEDLSQLGFIYLIRAVDNYNNTDEASFSTYAYKVVHNGILTNIRDTRYGVVYGRKIICNIGRVKELIREGASNEDISKLTNIKKEDIIHIAHYITPLSLNIDRPINGKSKGTESRELIDLIKYQTPIYETDFDFYDMISSLSDREQFVINGLFKEEKSQSEIGKSLGISQNIVSRIKRSAIEKLREEYIIN